MNNTAPSASAFASSGWKLASENSRPATLPPIAAPFNPSFVTASSSCIAASSGCCIVSDARPANRSGRDAHSSDRWRLFRSQIAPAVSMSARYQNGLMLRTSVSIDCASISRNRWSITTKCSRTPRTGGSTAFASAPIRSMASWK